MHRGGEGVSPPLKVKILGSPPVEKFQTGSTIPTLKNSRRAREFFFCKFWKNELIFKNMKKKFRAPCAQKFFGFSKQGYSGYGKFFNVGIVLPVWNFFNGGRTQDFGLQRGERPLPPPMQLHSYDPLASLVVNSMIIPHVYLGLQALTLHFVVLSFDRYSRDDVIGEVMLELEDLDLSNSDNNPVPISREITPRSYKVISITLH